MPDPLRVSALGPTSYRDGLALQAGLVEARASGRTGDWLLFPDHPPVLTRGRGAGDDSLRVPRETLERLGLEVFEVPRGGDITWHGPGQLVGYTICDLTARDRDLHRFLRDLEAALIDALDGFGITGVTVPGRTGVWVGDAKIASIGVAVRRWVSFHGFALNVAPDLRFFDLIHPCGLRGIRMTSLERELAANAPTLATARHEVAAAVASRLGHDGLAWQAPEAARIAAGLAGETASAAAPHAA